MKIKGICGSITSDYNPEGINQYSSAGGKSNPKNGVLSNKSMSKMHANNAVKTATKAVQESKARIAEMGKTPNTSDLHDRYLATRALSLSKAAQESGKPSDHMKAANAHEAAGHGSDKNGEHHESAAASHRLAAYRGRGGRY
jgi:hypothetical protein